MPIVSMGKFTAIGMRVKVPGTVGIDCMVINTCGQNDTAERGNIESWVWSNPTNRAITHKYHDIEAVSVECLWQGCKILREEIGSYPNPETIGGNWRKGKGRAPRGAYAGPGNPLITNPGEARRKIYIPAFRNLVEHWMNDWMVVSWIEQCRRFDGPIYLRDHDTGRGLDRNGPMSHAWVLCTFLNTGRWPE